MCVLWSLCEAKVKLQTRKVFLGKLLNGRDSKTMVIAYCLGKERRRSCCEPACKLAIKMREAVLYFRQKMTLIKIWPFGYIVFNVCQSCFLKRNIVQKKIFHEGSSFRQDTTTFKNDSDPNEGSASQFWELIVEREPRLHISKIFLTWTDNGPDGPSLTWRLLTTSTS